MERLPNYQKADASASKQWLVPMKSGCIGCQEVTDAGKSSIAFFLFFAFLLTCALSHWTPAYGATFQLKMHDNRLSLNAADADLSGILQRLGQAAGIVVRFPKALQNKITLSLSDVRLETALERILKGLNYATVYTVPESSDVARISKVYIFSKKQESVRSKQSILRERRIQNRISYYEKRIRSLQQRMSNRQQDNPAVQRYQRQIRNYQRIIERLQRQK